MRWRFLDRGIEEEARRETAVLAAIDRWWTAFVEHEQQIAASFRGQSAFDIPGFMAESLGPVEAGMCWEFGDAGSAGDFLAITPEDDFTLTTLAATILERAPKLPQWVFHMYRPRVPAEHVAAVVAGRVGGAVEGWTATAQHGEEYRVDVTCFAPRREAQDERARARACVAVESLLGERLYHEWVGAIDIKAAGWLKSGKPLAALPTAVDGMIAEMHGRLPSEPCWRMSGQPAPPGREPVGTIFKLEPSAAADYPAQRDMFVGKTMIPRGMWLAAHGQSPFFSSRFTRCSETFCYVKLDSSQGLDPAGFKDKSEIEDALDEALLANELGVSVGGGTGRRYSYVDLALVDVHRGIDVIRAVLQKGRVPRRSWIQFFDADLATEWIGVYPDSPPPPMP